MAQGGHSNKRWTFKWTRHLYRSLSKSEFEKWIPADRTAIEIAALDFLSCANCIWMQGMARVRLLDLRLQIGVFCASRLSVLL